MTASGMRARAQGIFLDRALDPTQHAGPVASGAISTARIVLLGMSMDVIYQLKVLHRFYPVEALHDCDPAGGRSVLHLPVDRRDGLALAVRARATGSTA